MPEHISKECKDLLKRLLEKKPADRITIEGVKDHEFFREIDWEAVYYKQAEPPVFLTKQDGEEEKS